MHKCYLFLKPSCSSAVRITSLHVKSLRRKCLNYDVICQVIEQVWRRSLQSACRSSVPFIDNVCWVFFSFYIYIKKKRKKNCLKRRLLVKPVSTGNLQGHALDTTLECRLMGNQAEAIGESHSPAALSLLARALTLLQGCTRRMLTLITAKSIVRNTHTHTQPGTL